MRAHHFVLKLLLVAAGVLGLAQSASAGVVPNLSCHDSGFLKGKAITDLCWTCFFPIKVFGVPVGFGNRGTSMLPSKTAAPICVCPGRTMGIPSPGITVGYHVPEHVIEVVRSPFCSPMLGMQLGSGNLTFQGIMAKAQLGGTATTPLSGKTDGEAASYNFHWIKFPGGMLVNMLMDSVCTSKLDLDLDYVYFTEFDPAWHSELIALYTHPEIKLFTKIYAHAVCMADGVAATIRKPIPGAFWCAGGWGMVYPMAGKIPYQSDFQSQMLVGARGLAAMHRRGLATNKYGDLNVCHERRTFVMPHQQYQFQNFWPRPIRTQANWIGTSEWRWGIGRVIPVMGEDRLIMEWDYRECCVTLY